ncbi:MAG: hypothetical protein HHJ09_13890 [Glaciimonas sp.]|nr:hypothetical protein [Glaciimonas sp.]
MDVVTIQYNLLSFHKKTKVAYCLISGVCILQQSEQQKRIAAKPSLLSSSDQNDTGNVRILNMLSQGASLQAVPSPVRRRLRLFVFVFGLVAIAVAGTLMSGSDNRLTVLAPVSIHSQPVPEALSESTSTSVNTPSQPFASLPDTGKRDLTAASTAATIITDTPIALVKIDEHNNLTTVLEAGVKPPPAALQSALEAPSTPDPVKPVAVVQAPQVNRVTSAKADKQPAKPSKQAASQSNNIVDSDTKLIAALVAYSTERDPKQAAKNAVPVTKPDNLAHNNNGAEANAQSTQHNRDVVARQMGDSTASLLQRCKSLGFVEGELCRLRICAGRWDSDAACKVK